MPSEGVERATVQYSQKLAHQSGNCTLIGGKLDRESARYFTPRKRTADEDHVDDGGRGISTHHCLLLDRYYCHFFCSQQSVIHKTLSLL